MSMKTEKQYETFSIQNRRYLGNKYKLLNFITDTVENECKSIKIFADIFSGTGSVASAFIDKQLITNDIMYSNYITNYAWFSPEKYDKQKIIEQIVEYNQQNIIEDNYMTENFADTYFSRNDCSKIGYIREDIEKQYQKQHLNNRERALLITSLIYAMDRIANTCGHYDAYRKGIEFTNHLILRVPLANQCNNKKNECFQKDANLLVREIKPDIIYIDPPYNSRQYCDAYHLLENVAVWGKPKVYGVAKKMERAHIKSNYCTTKAVDAFSDLIENINAQYILFSYNNMSNKGNNRSNAKLTDKDILDILNAKGETKIFETDYRAFTTGKSNIEKNAVFFFVYVNREMRS